MKPDARTQSVDEIAAHWFLRLRDDDVHPEEIAAALDWEAEDPAHAQAMHRVDAFWRQSDALPSPKLPELTVAATSARRDNAAASAVFGGWGRRVAIAASLLLLVLGVSFLAWQRQGLDAVTTTAYATNIGEHRSYALSDGSVMTLSAASSATVSYSRKQREVSLTSGEAYFKVAKDNARPFTVSALGGRVRVIGTMFNVHRGENRVVVSVAQGVVNVEPRLPANAREVLPATRLGAGYQLSYLRDGETSSVQRVDPEFVATWQTGKLFFFDRSLEEIVFDLNRYSRKRIVIDSDHARSLRFTGMVATDRVDEWLNGLQKTMQIRLVEGNDRLILTLAFPQ